MEGAGGLAPALFVHITLLWAIPSGLHMIEDPVPHNKEHGTIRRAEVAELCKINDIQAKHLVRRITEKYQQFQQRGSKRGTHYIWVDQPV